MLPTKKRLFALGVDRFAAEESRVRELAVVKVTSSIQ